MFFFLSWLICTLCITQLDCVLMGMSWPIQWRKNHRKRSNFWDLTSEKKYQRIPSEIQCKRTKSLKSRLCSMWTTAWWVIAISNLMKRSISHCSIQALWYKNEWKWIQEMAWFSGFYRNICFAAMLSVMLLYVRINLNRSLYCTCEHHYHNIQIDVLKWTP
mgnify:CR=1 FL=1